MIPPSQIILTGAAGFIGSVMLQKLNEEGFENIVIVDDFSREDKRPNWEQKKISKKIDRAVLANELSGLNPACVIHLGARTDTTEFDYSVHQKLNVEYSEMLWKYCAEKQLPLIYASSAATYGDGSMGYVDNHELPFELEPLNPYGRSKNEFDKWALKQWAGCHSKNMEKCPPAWAGLKFFNVYGPNEYHKGRMASVIFHAFHQIRNSGKVKLFRSHKDGFEDGKQMRDFIYVNDIADVIFWMMYNMQNPEWNNGLYNLGTGKARTFLDLAKATFAGMELEPNIEFIDMPEDIRDKYQYFTEANMKKLRDAGYTHPFFSLEGGVRDYVQNYLRSSG